jgi:hypothetical protein
MPRRSRRKIVGKQPEFDANTRARELRILAHELHALWLARRISSDNNDRAA